jgi:peptidoglycan/xylan/chitin deacetylase (PgdA/CDA1 family)
MATEDGRHEERGHEAGALSRRSVLALGAALALAACAPEGTQPQSASPDPASTTGRPSSPPSHGAPSATTSGTSSAVAATEVTHGPRSTPTVALTFHGAGDPTLADKVLGEAERAGAKVTVLAVGTWLQAYPSVASRILNAGHELGNHTLHHLPMRTMSAQAAYNEIVGGQAEVLRHTATPGWFRPSGTPHATPHILAAAARAGYRTSLSFDVDPADYADPGATVVTARVLAAVKPGSIVSLHLGHAGTAASLPHILDGLASRGLTAVTVSTLLAGVTP